MDFDYSAFSDIVRERGREVYSMTCDGGGPGCSYSEGIVKFAGYYFAYDDNGEFGGPYEDLSDAFEVMALSFGETEVSISVSGLAPSTIASILTADAPAGFAILINGETWVLGEDGEFSSESQVPRVPRKPRKPRTKEQTEAQNNSIAPA